MPQSSVSKMFKRFAAACVLVALGCGTGAETVSVESQQPPPVKAMLTDVATTGELGSAAESIRTALEEMKSTDPAKAGELLSDLSELESLADSGQIKAKAQSMADKL